MKNLLYLVIFSLPLLLFSVVKAEEVDFRNSSFTISGNTLRHTYLLNGVEKSSNYSLYKEGEKSLFSLNDVLCPGYKTSNSAYVYKLESSEKHTQNANGRTTQSSYYLLVKNIDGTYKTGNLYYKTHLYSGSGTCFAPVGVSDGSKEYRDTQNYGQNSFISQYSNHINNNQPTVKGISTRNTDNPFSISGTIKINFDGAKVTKQKTGNADFPDPDSTHTFEAELWHKDDTSYTSLGEKATINTEGHFNFPSKIRPSGSYVVASIVYSDGKDFTSSEIVSLGDGSNPTIPQENPNDDVTTAECFFARNNTPLTITPDAPSKDYSVELVAKTTGNCQLAEAEHQKDDSDNPACAIFESGGVTNWIYSKVIAKPICFFANFLLGVTQEWGQWVGTKLNELLY